MRVLLSGASGAIGIELALQLTSAGHDVTGITRLPGRLSGSTARELVAAVNDRAGLLSAVANERFDAVIHQATGPAHLPRTFAGMRDTNRLRSEGTSTLIAAARATGAERFVVASTTYGYGFSDHGPGVLEEDAPFALLPGDRLNAVLSALLSSEQQARAFGGIVLRLGQPYRQRGVMPTVARDWRGILPFVHVADAAAASVRALEHGAPGAVYNIVDNGPATWRDLHVARAAALDAPEPTAYPSWLLRALAPFAAELLTRTSMRVSNARAISELGWRLRYPTYRDALVGGADAAARARTVLSGRADAVRP